MAVHDLLGDGQAQAGAAGLAGAGLVHPVKALEDPAPVLLGNADAEIIMAPPLGVYLMELDTIFIITWTMRSRSARISGRAGGRRREIVWSCFWASNRTA